MTQRERVLQMLRDAGTRGVCSDEFIRNYLPRGCARVYDLRKEGYEIEAEREGKYTRFRLVGVGAGQPIAHSERANRVHQASVDPGDSPQSPSTSVPSLAGVPEAQDCGDARLFSLPSMSAQTNQEAA